MVNSLWEWDFLGLSPATLFCYIIYLHASTALFSGTFPWFPETEMTRVSLETFRNLHSTTQPLKHHSLVPCDVKLGYERIKYKICLSLHQRPKCTWLPNDPCSCWEPWHLMVANTMRIGNVKQTPPRAVLGVYEGPSSLSSTWASHLHVTGPPLRITWVLYVSDARGQTVNHFWHWQQYKPECPKSVGK